MNMIRLSGLSFPPLRPVMFGVSAEFQGFQQTVVSNVNVDTSNVSTVNITLKAGEVATSVEVTGAAPLVQTSLGALLQTVDQRTINKLPLNGRKTLALTQSSLTGGLTSGVLSRSGLAAKSASVR